MKRIICLIKHHTMKTCGGMEVQLHEFLTSALDGGDWSASPPGRFTPGRNKVPIGWEAVWAREQVWTQWR